MKLETLHNIVKSIVYNEDNSSRDTISNACYFLTLMITKNMPQFNDQLSTKDDMAYDSFKDRVLSCALRISQKAIEIESKDS
jgi:hypothetical protein